MKKGIIVGVVGILLIAGIVLALKPGSDDQAVKKESTSASESIPIDPNSISIDDFAFNPAKLTIKKGTKVTWTNNDDARHDITPTGGASDFLASKLLTNGESYEFTFNTVGTYTYKCSPHPYMKGTIEVTE